MPKSGGILPRLVAGVESSRVLAIHDTLEARATALFAAFVTQYQRAGRGVIYIAFEKIPHYLKQLTTACTVLDCTEGVSTWNPIRASDVLSKIQTELGVASEAEGKTFAVVIATTSAGLTSWPHPEVAKLITLSSSINSVEKVIMYNHQDCCRPEELAKLRYLAQTNICVEDASDFQRYALHHRKLSGKVVYESGNYRVTKAGKVECQRDGQRSDNTRVASDIAVELAQHVTSGLIEDNEDDERGMIRYDKGRGNADNEGNEESDDEDPDADLDI